eukprot:1125995-Amphidinium_carterae.1
MGEHPQPVVGMRSCFDFSQAEASEKEWRAREWFVVNDCEVLPNSNFLPSTVCCKSYRIVKMSHAFEEKTSHKGKCLALHTCQLVTMQSTSVVFLTNDDILLPYVQLGVEAREQIKDDVEGLIDMPVTRPDHPLVKYAEEFTHYFDLIAVHRHVHACVELGSKCRFVSHVHRLAIICLGECSKSAFLLGAQKRHLSSTRLGKSDCVVVSDEV